MSTTSHVTRRPHRARGNHLRLVAIAPATNQEDGDDEKGDAPSPKHRKASPVSSGVTMRALVALGANTAALGPGGAATPS